MVLGRWRRRRARGGVVGCGCRCAPEAAKANPSPSHGMGCDSARDTPGASSASASHPAIPQTRILIVLPPLLRRGSGSRMKLRMHLPEIVPVEMRVDLRRLDGPVSQELLHHAQVAAALEEVRGA